MFQNWYSAPIPNTIKGQTNETFVKKKSHIFSTPNIGAYIQYIFRSNPKKLRFFPEYT